MKTCACGRHYTRKSWRSLRLRGTQDDGAGGRLELRNCARCGSTLAVELPKREAQAMATP